MAKEIINLTGHPITIIGNSEYNPLIRKSIIPKGKEPKIIKVIPSYEMAFGKYKTIGIKSDDDIPRVVKEVAGCDGLPAVDDIENTDFVVSVSYAKAYFKMHPKYKLRNFYTVGDLVYDSSGKNVVGCRALSLFNEYL